MEEKINELEKRIAKLERIEKRRKSLLIAKVAAIVLIVIAIIVAGFILYLKVEELLKPYKDFIETKDTVKDSVNNGVDTVKDGVNDGINTVKDILNKN